MHPNPNNATENQLLSIPNVNLNDFDSKSAADPTDLATMDKFWVSTSTKLVQERLYRIA